MVEPPLPLAPEAPFPPLPLRPRGAVELLDASIKLYRQYFGVLLGWSALITVVNVLSSFVAGGLIGFFLTPIEFGVTACCLAAAVRGQRVTFKQCWDFTQPRYGSLLLMSFLCSLILILLMLPLAIVFGVAIGVGAAGSGSASLLISLGVITLIALLVLGSYATIWYYMTMTVVCFEDDKRNTSSMGHAYQLLKGQWGRILGITLLLGLIGLILLSVIGAVVFIAGSGAEVIKGISSSSSQGLDNLVGIILSFTLLSSLVSILLTPLFHLCVSTSYLDIRTRKEALDLQWATHVASPVPPSPYAVPTFLNAPGEMPYQNTSQGYQQGYAPQGYSPQNYAPGQPYSPQYGYPQSGSPQPGYPQQSYGAQGYAPPSYPPTPYPQPSAGQQSTPLQTPPPTPTGGLNYPPSLLQSAPSSSQAPVTPPNSALTTPLIPSPTGQEASPSFSQPSGTTPAPPSSTLSTGVGTSAGMMLPGETQVSWQERLEDEAAARKKAAEVAAVTSQGDIVTCSQCGAVSPRGQRFCMTCGNTLPTS